MLCSHNFSAWTNSVLVARESAQQRVSWKPLINEQPSRKQHYPCTHASTHISTKPSSLLHTRNAHQRFRKRIMSWQGYVDTNLVGTGKISQAAIIGLKGGVWATSSDFNVSGSTSHGGTQATSSTRRCAKEQEPPLKAIRHLA